MGHAVLVDELRYFHIEATVARDLHDLPLTPPLDSLQALRCLTAAERRSSDLVQLGAVIDRLVEVSAEIETCYLTWKV